MKRKQDKVVLEAPTPDRGVVNLVNRLWAFLAPSRESKLSEGKMSFPVPEQRGWPKKVLIVDDDAVVRHTTSLKLRTAGYEVSTAVDCSEAIKAVGQERPDAILLDLSFPPDDTYASLMPWDGFRLMSWLRGLENARHTRFVIITVSNSPQCRQQAQASGAVAFFEKPVDHDRLLAVLKKELGEEVPDAARRSQAGIAV